MSAIQDLCPALRRELLARGVGKSTLLEQAFNPNEALFIDLLDPEVLSELSLEPKRFKSMIEDNANKDKIIIVDEIQKLPLLLQYVQIFIQKKKRVFVLTGSSARRLKQVGSNLLAGRAFVYSLFPFSGVELGDQFDLSKALEWGGLPDAYFAKSPEYAKEYLNAYVLTYIEKEIQQEQWVRNIVPFRRFLQVAAQMNGKIINYASIARDVGVDDATVKQYFEILEDTFIGHVLPAHDHSVRRAQRTAPKFYLFDTGIKRALEKTLMAPLVRASDFGEAFEHWIYLELVKGISYNRLDWSLSYARSRNDVEVDFIITRPKAPSIQIEVKSMEKVNEDHANGLETLGKDLEPRAHRYLLSQDPLQQKFGSTKAMYWRLGLKEIFEL